jgi:hypothetical protein
MEEKRNGYWFLVGKAELKKAFGRSKCRWSDIRMDLRKTGLEAMDWNDVARERIKWRVLRCGTQ